MDPINKKYLSKWCHDQIAGSLSQTCGKYMGVEPKKTYPQIIHWFIGLEPWFSPSILGENSPYFWKHPYIYINPGIPTTIKTMGVNITTIVYLRVLIIQIGSAIILVVVEAQGKVVDVEL